MIKMFSVCYEADDFKDDSAVLMVFDGQSTKILKAFSGQKATELYKQLVEDSADERIE